MNSMNKHFSMKKYLFLFIIIPFFSNFSYSQAYQSGEYLQYRVHYGFLNAGFASLKVSNESLNGRSHFHVKGEGSTSGAVRIFFKVDDRYETYIDPATKKPSLFIRDIREGGYTKNKQLSFDHSSQQVEVKDFKKGKSTTYKFNTEVQDMLSAFYFLRTKDNSYYKNGSSININIFMDEKIYPFKLVVEGREKISTKFGEIEAIRMKPYVQKGRVFRENESVKIWVSDDDNLIPLRIEAELAVGSLKMDLHNYKNLKYPILFK